MKRFITSLCTISLVSSLAFTQHIHEHATCSYEHTIARHLKQNPNALEEMQQNEAFIQAFLENMKKQGANLAESQGTYVIPVVLHVFHYGDDGKIDLDQAQSGIDIMNDDFNGLNDGWDDVDPQFEDVKGTLDIQFCLASIDPDGNPTTGVNYYEDSLAMLNEVDLFDYAWDNYKYLNIYMPKYTGGEPSLFTAYAYFPSTTAANNDRGGIFYSSIRWGYGNHSELAPGQDWASVGTHEAGHWLDLYHTFQGGCGGSGDLVNDTPPTTGGTIELQGCDNNDFSCGVATNGENFMDYNHDCKIMFTQGQVDRMTAALYLPSRITLWSEDNLIATGCQSILPVSDIAQGESVKAYPNPTSDFLTFEFEEIPNRLAIYDVQGKVVFEKSTSENLLKINTYEYPKGLYFYFVTFNNTISSGKIVVK